MANKQQFDAAIDFAIEEAANKLGNKIVKDMFSIKLTSQLVEKVA